MLVTCEGASLNFFALIKLHQATERRLGGVLSERTTTCLDSGRVRSFTFRAGVASQVVRSEIRYRGVVASVLPNVLEYSIVVDLVEPVMGGCWRGGEQCHREASEGLHIRLYD